MPSRSEAERSAAISSHRRIKLYFEVRAVDAARGQ